MIPKSDKRRAWALDMGRGHSNRAAVSPNLIAGLGLVLTGVLVVGLMAVLASHAPEAAGDGTVLLLGAGTLAELVEKREERDVKAAELGKVFEEAGTGDDGKSIRLERVKCLGDLTTAEKAKRIEQMNRELSDIGVEIDALESVEQAAADMKRRTEQKTEGQRIYAGEKDAEQKAGEFDPTGTGHRKSLGRLFIESTAYTGRQKGATPSPAYRLEGVTVDMKTLFSTSAGWAPESLRSGRIVEEALRPIQIIDLLPMETTGENSVKYMEETTVTNNAAERAEGGAVAESAIAYTEQTVTIESVGSFIPVSDEMLEDEPRVESLINNRLMFMVRQRLDSQLINGNGSSPNIEGLLNVSGIQTQAKGADPVPDAIRKAMTLVRVTGRAQPDGVILHPNDWQDIRLLRTTDGIYIWGSPAESGPERIWGRQVVESDALSENTGIVGDFRNFSALATRRQVDLQVGFINDDFQKLRKSIRAEGRFAAVWYRPAAFATVTGI